MLDTSVVSVCLLLNIILQIIWGSPCPVISLGKNLRSGVSESKACPVTDGHSVQPGRSNACRSLCFLQSMPPWATLSLPLEAGYHHEQTEATPHQSLSLMVFTSHVLLLHDKKNVKTSVLNRRLERSPNLTDDGATNL